MNTVFVAMFEGVESKNILRTAILPTLLSDPGVRLLLLVKNRERADYLAQEFTDPRIIYEAADFPEIRRMDRFFRWLRFLMLRSETTDLRRQMRRQEGQPSAAYLVGAALNRFLARPWAQRMARRLDFLLVRDCSYAFFFDRYDPALIVAANLFDELEMHLVREAKRRGVPSVGFINSWDKASGRSAIRILPDQFIVFNRFVRDELIRYHGVRPERIFIGGIPQYDRYFELKPRSREALFRPLGIDPSKKLIVYSPIGGVFKNSDWAMIDLLERLRREGRFGDDAELLVRFPPNDFFDEREFVKRPWLRYQYPGVRFSKIRGLDWDMTFAELGELADTLFHMSVLVCYGSSLSVDAAVLNKPVININFDVIPNLPLSKLPTRFYTTSHYSKALATGGIRLVKSAEELVASVRRYLNDPTVDAVGRQALARSQCEFLDGKSGQRIGRFILNFLQGRG